MHYTNVLDSTFARRRAARVRKTIILAVIAAAILTAYVTLLPAAIDGELSRRDAVIAQHEADIAATEEAMSE